MQPLPVETNGEGPYSDEASTWTSTNGFCPHPPSEQTNQSLDKGGQGGIKAVMMRMIPIPISIVYYISQSENTIENI